MLNAVMNKFKKFITFFVFALFFTIIGYEYPIIIDNSKKYFKYQLKKVGFIDSFINKTSDIEKLNSQIKDNVDSNFNEVPGNSFSLKYKKIMYIDDRTSGFFVSDDSKNNSFEIYLQEGIVIKTKNSAEELSLPLSITFEKNGGVKSVFKINKNVFLLVSNKKNFNCYYSSIYNLTKKKIIFSSECLPDIENIDFNGIGGAFLEFEDNILLSIGSPEWNSNYIRNLAQDESSVYGKFILFNKEPFLKNEMITKEKYIIFSKGHKNPQSVIKVEDKFIAVEHGPQGGDELNVIKKNNNYGWPLVSYGTLYNDGKSFNQTRANFESPIFSFLPSIAPSAINNCPQNLKNYYSTNHCLMILSLRGMALFVVLLDKKKLNVVSIEEFKIDQRIRHFGLNSKNLLFQKNNSFYISVDGEGIYETSFGNFR